MPHHGLPDPPDKAAGIVFLIGGIASSVILAIASGIGQENGSLAGTVCVAFPCLISIACIAYGLYVLLLSWASFP